MGMKVKLSNNQLSVLDNRSKLYNSVKDYLTKAYFKIERGTLSLYLKGQKGMLRTKVAIDYDGDEVAYIAFNYDKWNKAISKFSMFESVTLEVTSNLMRIYHESSNHARIDLSINAFKEGSQEATTLNTFIDRHKEEILNDNCTLILTRELISNLELMSSLMASQKRTNSVGLFEDKIIYSDRITVIRAGLNEPFSNDNLFANLEDDENYIAVHLNFMRLFVLASMTSNKVNYSKDANRIYWVDNETELVLETEPTCVALPTDEDFQNIIPEEDMFLNLELKSLSKTMGFFNGFYESSGGWNAIKFVVKDGEASLYLKSTESELDNRPTQREGKGNGEFEVDASTLDRILSSFISRVSVDSTPLITIYFDEEAPGIYFKSNDNYDFVLSRLGD